MYQFLHEVNLLNIFQATADFITNLSGHHFALAIILWVVFGLVVTLRIMLYFAYSGAILLINMSTKNIKSREDIKRLGNNTFGRMAREYVHMAEKVGRVDALALAQMALVKNNVLFFNFKSLAGCITALERAFPIFAILAIFATAAEGEFIIMAAVIFLLLILLSAIFDITASKEKYIATLAHVLARDIGQFFPTEATASIYTLRNEMKEDIKMLTTAIERFYDLNLGVSAHNDTVAATLALVQTNQTALDKAVGLYETSMKELTTSLGDALGKIVQYHLDTSGSKIAEHVAESIRTTTVADAEQAGRLAAVMEEINENGRVQTRIMMNIKEQLVGNDEN